MTRHGTPARLLPSFLLLAALLPQPTLHAQINGVEHARLISVVNLDATVYHVQGVDLDTEHIWVTSVDSKGHRAWLHQFSRATAKFERQVDITDGPRYHPGGFSIQGDSIWVPVAEYRPHSTAVIEELDKRTLVLKRKIFVPDHLGCLAVTRDNLIAGNWNSKKLYVLDMSGNQIRVIENRSRNNYQDMKFNHGMLVASGVFTRSTGAVDFYEWPSMQLLRRLRAGVTDRGPPYTAEGMAIEGNDLYFVPEDVHARLFHFAIDGQ